MEKQDLSIVMHAYYATSGSVMVDGQMMFKGKGQYVGGAGVTARCTLEEAKIKARDLWKEYYPDTMKQIRIINENNDLVFEADNFNKFK